jgi:ectoine hydroxylase-related dioxygenase (phytanoyl-CoA dioxygenase family)
MSVIGQSRKKFWNDNGFLVFSGFFDEHEIAAVESAGERAWRELPDDVVVDDLVTNRRRRIGKLSDDEKRHRFKVNDLYLIDSGLREAAMSERIGMVLSDLLEDQPVMINTLNFDKGSQQIDHLDTLYMTPVSELGLVATWMALEDATADAGPLRYYPGSNHIPHYRFSTGSFHQYDAEVEQFSDYMAGEVEKRGLEEQRFIAEQGDLFIWHALLLHGGSEICNPELTRNSLVTHYFTQTDCEQLRADLRPMPGGWWIQKPHLAVPEEQGPADGATSKPDFPGLQADEQTTQPRGLRERLSSLRGARD